MQCIVYESALGQRVLVLIISHSYRPSTGLHRKFPCSYYVEPLLSAQENADPRSIIRDAKLMRVFQDKRTNQSIGIRSHDLLNDSISPCDQEEQTKRDQEAMESICLEVRSRRSANDFERPDQESLFKLVAVTGSSVGIETSSTAEVCARGFTYQLLSSGSLIPQLMVVQPKPAGQRHSDGSKAQAACQRDEVVENRNRFSQDP